MGSINDVSQLPAPQHGVKQCCNRQLNKRDGKRSGDSCFLKTLFSTSIDKLFAPFPVQQTASAVFLSVCLCAPAYKLCLTVFPEGHECKVGNERSEGSFDQGEDDSDGVGEP